MNTSRGRVEHRHGATRTTRMANIGNFISNRMKQRIQKGQEKHRNRDQRNKESRNNARRHSNKVTSDSPPMQTLLSSTTGKTTNKPCERHHRRLRDPTKEIVTTTKKSKDPTKEIDTRDADDDGSRPRHRHRSQRCNSDDSESSSTPRENDDDDEKYRKQLLLSVARSQSTQSTTTTATTSTTADNSYVLSDKMSDAEFSGIINKDEATDDFDDDDDDDESTTSEDAVVVVVDTRMRTTGVTKEGLTLSKFAPAAMTTTAKKKWQERLACGLMQSACGTSSSNSGYHNNNENEDCDSYGDCNDDNNSFTVENDPATYFPKELLNVQATTSHWSEGYISLFEDLEEEDSDDDSDFSR